MDRALVIRGASLALGAAANLMFLGLGASALGPYTFGYIVVATNIALAVQVLDFGITSAFVNECGSRGDNRPSVHEYMPAALTVAAMVASGGAILTLRLMPPGTVGLPLSGYAGVMLVIGLGAIVSAGMKLPLGILVGCGRSGSYYAALFAQPFILFVGTLLVSQFGGGALMLATAFAAAQVSPGLAALTMISRRRVAYTVTRGRGLSLRERLRTSGTLGLSQVANVLGFGLTPALVGLFAGPAWATAYAVPHRVFTAGWSLVGVQYTNHWQRMAQLRTTPEDQEAFARVVSGASVRLAVLVAGATAAASPLLLRLSGVDDTGGFYLVLFIFVLSIVVRASFLGPMLRYAANYPRLRPAAMEVAAAGLLIAVLAIWADVTLALGALLVLLFAVLESRIVRRGVR